MKYNYNKYDNQVKDIEEIEGTDIKINPDYYIHLALIKAQDCLVKDDVNGGFLQYVSVINYIENLCKAANMLPDNYAETITEYKQKDEYRNIKNDLTKMVRLADYKLNLLMQEVFMNKVITEPLKL
jgi:hypothetical protein